MNNESEIFVYEGGGNRGSSNPYLRPNKQFHSTDRQVKSQIQTEFKVLSTRKYFKYQD